MSFNVATDSALPLTLGVIALAGMPAAIAAVICADELLESVRHRAESVRESWHEQRTLDRLERAFAPAPPAGPPSSLPWSAVARVASVAIVSARDSVAHFAAGRLTAAGIAPGWLPTPAPAGAPPVPFEQVVAQLRELRGRRDEHRHDDPAYDHALRDACQCLGIVEYLAEVSGLDLEIERVRVESALQAAGIPLP